MKAKRFFIAALACAVVCLGALVLLVAEVLVINSKNAWLRKYNFFTKENKQ